jgi:peptidoglycan/xylan/chitin deacetylase (PgdA/CDA1 family)
MYHYVRDLPRTRFPEIKGMLTDDFAAQVKQLRTDFEMTTLDSALEFMIGNYHPRRNLCLMTFDDGLKEHFNEVTPILAESGIQGLFFLISGCVQGRTVAPVHMNHFLMAHLDFAKYQELFLGALQNAGFDNSIYEGLDATTCKRTYPRDSTEVARFKYLFNFILDTGLRDRIVKDLFESWVAPEREFSEELYLSWSEARQMQQAGMVIGGHSHTHRPLSKLTGTELELDLETCWSLITAHLLPQARWPFCYPYGKADSFNHQAVVTLKRLGFACSFATEAGTNQLGANLYALRRFDCKDILSDYQRRSEEFLTIPEQVV